MNFLNKKYIIFFLNMTFKVRAIHATLYSIMSMTRAKTSQKPTDPDLEALLEPVDLGVVARNTEEAWMTHPCTGGTGGTGRGEVG